MSNKLRLILESISDEELKVCVTEIKERHITGILVSGVARKLARTIHKEIGVEMHHSLQIAEQAAIEIAAFKWAGV